MGASDATEINARLLERCESHAEEIVSVRALYFGVKTKLKEMETAIANHTKENQMLRELQKLQRQRLDTQTAELKHLRTTLAERQAESNENLQARESATTEIESLRESLAAASQEIKMLRQLLQAREKRTQSDEKLLQQKTIEIQRHEKRLYQYAVTLNHEKSQIRQHSQQLAQELRTATTTHPLRDYLALTESEMSKLELQLKKLPASAPDRPALEECFGQLIAQRDFLRSMIDNSKRQLARQADTVGRIVSGPTLVPVPPPPPTLPRPKIPSA